MKMRASPGLFLLLLMIGAIIVPTRRLPATGPSGTWHVGQSTNAQAGSRQALLEQPEGSRANIEAAYGKLPLSFETNRGQTDAHVQFISRGSGYTLYLTATEAVLTLQRPLGFGEPPVGPGSPLVSSKRKGLGETQNAKRKERENAAHNTLRIKLVGANVATIVEGLQALPGKTNYFIGNDPAKWRTDIPAYAKIRYKAIYPGTDLVYYGNQRQLEYDFVLAPGADPRIIRLAIAGSEKLEAGTDGGLVLRTTGGEVRLHKPIVYQQVNGTRKEATGRYVLRGKREIGFEVAAYDASRPLIIDPVLSYSTYLGGSAGDFGNAIAVDASGNAYITGFTTSANFPTKNAFQAALSGANDAFVAKLDPTGSALVYSTFLGGTMDDFGNGIAVDSSVNAYVTGSTRSTNFPTASPFQANCKSCANGQGNAFVAKLSAAGSTLTYSTYLGGSGNGTDGDFGNGIAVDASNNAYVTGFTSSQDFPLASSIQASLLPQTCTFDYYGYTYTIPCSNTAFVTRLNPSGSALLYSTYLGASGGNLEYGSGIAVDGAGNAYVTGRATSNFLLTPGAIQLVSGGGDDTFVAKISPNDVPGFSLSSFSLSFQDEGIGGTTLSQQIFLANTGSLTLNITSIVPSGDFAATNTCGSSLAGGASCTISVTLYSHGRRRQDWHHHHHR